MLQVKTNMSSPSSDVDYSFKIKAKKENSMPQHTEESKHDTHSKKKSIEEEHITASTPPIHTDRSTMMGMPVKFNDNAENKKHKGGELCT